jgi:hypothetical protein
VSTFSELKEQAEQEIRAHVRSTSSNSTHHFVVDSTNYFVDHGAGLLAALRVWGESRRKTDADLRALIESADAATLESIAEGRFRTLVSGIAESTAVFEYWRGLGGLNGMRCPMPKSKSF